MPGDPTLIALMVVLAALLVFVLSHLVRSVRTIPQAHAGVVERAGRYHRTVQSGPSVLIPFLDRLVLHDLREQMVSCSPQPIVTGDNLLLSMEPVVYFRVVDPRAATYDIPNYTQAVERVTTTGLRNVVGGLSRAEALTSLDEIKKQVSGVLHEAAGQWGVRVSRVELKAIDVSASPPSTTDTGLTPATPTPKGN